MVAHRHPRHDARTRAPDDSIGIATGVHPTEQPTGPDVDLHDAVVGVTGGIRADAVGMDKAGILAAMERRLANNRDTEIATALDQIGEIVRLRLEDRT